MPEQDTSTVCGAIVDALHLAGWTINDACAATAVFQSVAMARSRSPVVITYRPDEAARAIALAAALTREGVRTQALELEPIDLTPGVYPLAILLRYL